ncbi:phage tail assembly protein [Alkanindiges illinoisensis]|uniref:phage tail assembly protein n=1 Tax=Alkanindiges illinoisensis TaxID=197183 RepID=UPI00047C2269|nr:phage tail assembly protein [Alkanindiges illinoisensis]
MQTAKQTQEPTADQLENRRAVNPDVEVINLDTPLMMGNQEITEVEVRKPNALALQGLKIADLIQGDVTSVLTLLPKVTTPTLTRAQVQQLDPCDIAQFGAVFITFLQPKSTRAALLQQQ